MMIWLKKCLYAKKEKEIGPFYLTMFFWRKLPMNKQKTVEKDLKLTIKNINLKIIQRIVLLFLKWGLFEIFYRWLTYNIPEMPEEIFPVRILNWITKGIPPFTPFLLFYDAITVLAVILSLSLGYDS